MSQRREFTVIGNPVPKARPRVTKYGHAYTPKKTVDYEKLVRESYISKYGDLQFEKGVMLDLRVIAYFEIPKSKSKKEKKLMEQHILRPTKKPDGDNVLKAIEDAISGIAYYDDAQIVDCQIRKYYSYEPRVVVVIQEVETKI